MAEYTKLQSEAIDRNVRKARAYVGAAVLSFAVSAGLGVSSAIDVYESGRGDVDQNRRELVSGFVKGVGSLGALGLTGVFGAFARKRYRRAQKHREGRRFSPYPDSPDRQSPGISSDLP